MRTLRESLNQIRVRRIVRKALALAPRGCVRNDVLMLHELREFSGQELQLHWWARNVHPWDHNLSVARQSELFSQQALHDTESALIRLFRRLPDLHEIAFRVLYPGVPNPVIPGENEQRDEVPLERYEIEPKVILTGNVERNDVIPEPFSPSIKMRLLMMGVRFLMVGGHLEPLAAGNLCPLEG
ncbi:MAG TPA: hypothetical protein VGR14_13435 [Verrucomicrobiae bacterium]|jgi:hypothetical protein|nr:hypothetical protein [Verrucomicrobiae bacterium]